MSPGPAVSVCPTCAVPAIDGAPVAGMLVPGTGVPATIAASDTAPAWSPAGVITPVTARTWNQCVCPPASPFTVWPAALLPVSTQDAEERPAWVVAVRYCQPVTAALAPSSIPVSSGAIQVRSTRPATPLEASVARFIGAPAAVSSSAMVTVTVRSFTCGAVPSCWPPGTEDGAPPGRPVPLPGLLRRTAKVSSPSATASCSMTMAAELAERWAFTTKSRLSAV